ncbi:hypothetical protein [Deinococcus sonorensis]|uniref:NurA domain-containing protein n=2 Tax=Deinococcus sonorensis TaxID=309891 RepID=A0AAU7UG01_9DEIO
MRSGLSHSPAFQTQLQDVARKMQAWETQALIGEDAARSIAGRLQFFEHTPATGPLTFAGIDGSGDYPMLTYADVFVYLTTAHATTYMTHPTPGQGLKEQRAWAALVNIAWLPGAYEVTRQETLAAFEAMTGESIQATIEGSDYRSLKSMYARMPTQEIIDRLVIPQASESGNHAIQLQTVGELGAALRMLRTAAPDYLLYDSTLALPMSTSGANSLFFEHLKRRVCVVAREKGTAFVAVSKAPGLPGVDDVERLALGQARDEGQPDASSVEHWYLRLPIPGEDDWVFPPADGRAVPPPGAVSYLVRFHRNATVLRVDLDWGYWDSHLKAETEAETRERERTLFQHLDYAGHDQRSYGYPYPMKAAHDHASLSANERYTLRTQLIDAAVTAGMNRKLFRDDNILKGHR